MKYILPQIADQPLVSNLSEFFQGGFDSLIWIILLNPSQNTSPAGTWETAVCFAISRNLCNFPQHSELRPSESSYALGLGRLHRCACNGRSVAERVAGEQG